MYTVGYTFIFGAIETVGVRVGRLPTPTGRREFYMSPFNIPLNPGTLRAAGIRPYEGLAFKNTFNIPKRS